MKDSSIRSQFVRPPFRPVRRRMAGACRPAYGDVQINLLHRDIVDAIAEEVQPLIRYPSIFAGGLK
jgi:hypothetical protein